MVKSKRLIGVSAVLALAVSLAVASAATARSNAAPTNTGNPTIEGPAGNPFVGDTLTASNGTWSGNPTSFTYQWDRCNPVGDRQGCGPIAGATSKAYKVQSADVDHTLRVRVTATNADGSATKDSKGTGVVSAQAAPKANTQPTISGTATVGSTLSIDNGTWSGATSFAYQWQSCDASGGACTDIAGATGKTYGVRSSDTGRTVRARVTATNKYGSTAATTGPTAAITTGAPAPKPKPTTTCAGKGTQDASAVALPSRMLIDRFQFSPGVVTPFTHAFTGRIHVSSTNGCSVAGAQLWATAIPYNQVNVARGATDSTGWATLTFTLKSGFPANPGRQQILAMLVRATQPGGSVLAGVSTRRTLRVNVDLHR